MVKSKAELFFVIFIIEDSLFVESTTPSLRSFSLHRNSILSEDEAKLLGNSVCQNLNVRACVSFVRACIERGCDLCFATILLLHYPHLLSLSALYLNSKAEGFATFRANQGIVFD